MWISISICFSLFCNLFLAFVKSLDMAIDMLRLAVCSNHTGAHCSLCCIGSLNYSLFSGFEGSLLGRLCSAMLVSGLYKQAWYEDAVIFRY